MAAALLLGASWGGCRRRSLLTPMPPLLLCCPAPVVRIGWSRNVTVEAFVVNIRDAAKPDVEGLVNPLLKRYSGTGGGSGQLAGHSGCDLRMGCVSTCTVKPGQGP